MPSPADKQALRSDLRLIQLSDCHVSADPAARYRGLNPRVTLEAVLEVAMGWQPDLLLVTGDLSEDASPESYRYLADQFAQLGVPVLSLPGNHDLPQAQKASFPDCPVDEPWVHDTGGWRLVLLNSTVANEVPGALSDRMLNGLRSCLAESPGIPKLLALHHQPVLTGSAWIDRYPLLKPERLWTVLDDYPEVRAVVWGHIHHVFSVRRRAMRLLGAPSTVANSLPEQAKFTHEAAGPACRWLRLGSGGVLSTGVLRCLWGFSPSATTTTG